MMGNLSRSDSRCRANEAKAWENRAGKSSGDCRISKKESGLVKINASLVRRNGPTG